MTLWKSIHQLKFLSVVLGLLGSSFLALGEDENPGKNLTQPTKENSAAAAMAMESMLNQSLSVQNLSEMSRLLSPSKIQVADLSQQAKEAKTLFDQLQSQGKILSTLTNSALQTLPIAVPIDNTSQGYLLIKKALFKPDHVELDVYARLLLGDQELYFGATGVKYVMASGLAGTVGLVMLGTQEFANTQYKVSLTGGQMSAAPSTTASQLKINCGSFDGLVLKGKLELNKDTFLKLDSKGYPLTNGSVVSSAIDFQATSLAGLTVKLKDQLAFTMKKSSGALGFLLKEVYFDFSEKSTPSTITQSVGTFFGTGTEMINQWTGLYATTTTLYLPMFFIPATSSNPNPTRPSFESTTFLMDESGIYMQGSGSAVANFNQLGGSPMSIDNINFRITQSNYKSLTIKGKIGILVAKSPFKNDSPVYDFTKADPDEYITYTGSLDDKSGNFALKVNKQANMYFLGAKSTLREDSKADFTKDDQSLTNRSATTRPAAGNNNDNNTPTATNTDQLINLYNSDSLAVGGAVLGNSSANFTQARVLIVPKLSFRYVIGLDLDGKKVSYDASQKNSEKVLSLGVFLVEDLMVGYSLLSKKPIFSFARMGYEQLGNAPVFGKFGLKRLMAEYDDTEKECTIDFTFYANINPVSTTQIVSTTQPAAANSQPSVTTSVAANSTSAEMNADGINIVIGIGIAFAWEVSEKQTSAIDFKSNFSGISLNTIQIKSGSDVGLTLDGNLNYENSEEYGRVCYGHITAEFKIKGLKKLFPKGNNPVSSTVTGNTPGVGLAGDSDSPRLTVNWLGGRQYPGTDSSFNFTYVDFLLSFGEAGVAIGPGVFVNGLGAGVSVNMTQTNDIGSRYSLTGKKFLPLKKVGGFLLAASFYATKDTQRGFLGFYGEFGKGENAGAGGFRKFSIFGTWEFARDATGVEPMNATDALSTASQNPKPATSSGRVQTPNHTLTNQQINNAVKLLDVSLDDKFAIFKFDLSFDASGDDFIMEGNLYGFMHAPLKTDATSKNSTDGNRSYVRGAADSEGAGFLGMVSFKIVVDDLIKEDKEQKESKKNGVKLSEKDTPNPVNGYLWIGRPDQPLAIEININLGRDESPTYLKIGATLYIVGGNVPLPSNQVVYTPIVENAKTLINNELISRGEMPINFNLPSTVMADGTGYFSLGLSLGGEVYLSTPTKAVSVYASIRLGIGVMVSYDKTFTSCNDSHWLGSGVFHGSGALGIAVNIKGSQTKFEILRGALTAAGVFDFKGSFGALTFEYSLLGGIIEGKAFMKFGDSPCLNGNRTYDVNSRVNLVKGTSPSATIHRSDTSSEADANFTKESNYSIERTEMIILKMDPEVPVYEWCNLRVDGGPTLENVFIAANYYSYGSGLRRFRSKQPNNQIRFISNEERTDIDTRKGAYKKWTYLHKPNVDLTLVAELVITDGSQEASSDWIPIEGTDFKQRFTFRTRTWDSYDMGRVDNYKDDNSSSQVWFYVRNP
ncbi:hypothetical protein GCM10028805_38760 [Spirosoma harenae]